MTAQVNAIQWKRVKFDRHCPRNPQPMVTKFATGDEVGDPYPCAKFYHDPLKNVWSLRRRRDCGHAQRQIFKEIRVKWQHSLRGMLYL